MVGWMGLLQQHPGGTHKRGRVVQVFRLCLLILSPAFIFFITIRLFSRSNTSPYIRSQASSGKDSLAETMIPRIRGNASIVDANTDSIDLLGRAPIIETTSSDDALYGGDVSKPVPIVDTETDLIDLPRPARHGQPYERRITPGGRRIGIMSAMRYDDDAKHRLFVREGYTNKECYAQRHGYDNIFITSQEGMGRVGDHKDGKELPDFTKWASTWAKIVRAQEYLPFYDWILICDSDYYILDYARSLESFIEEFEKSGEDIHLFVPREYPKTTDFAFSMFAMLVRNTPLMTTFMAEWIAHRYTCEASMFWGEQPHVFSAMVRTIRRFYSIPASPETDCVRYCPSGAAVPRPSSKIEAHDFLRGMQLNITRCMNKVCNEIELNVGHYDTKFKGPIVWSWGPSHVKFPERDVGLGLQLSYGIESNIYAINNTFAVHVKPVLPNVLADAMATAKQTGSPLKANHLAWKLVQERMEAQALEEGTRCWVRFAEMDDKAIVKLAENSETLTRAWFEQKVSNTRQVQRAS